MKINLMAQLFIASLFFCFFIPYADAESKKNKIIVLIGDGMGTAELSLLKSAWDYGRNNNLVPDRSSSYDRLLKLADISLLSVKPENFLVNDSACSSSNISTGVNCLPETLGLNKKGMDEEVFSDFASKNKISLGIISDTRLTHATPAAFYANVNHRKEERAIARKFKGSQTRLALSGGEKFFKHSIPDNYNIVRTKSELFSAEDLPLLGLFAENSMNDYFNESINDSPTLLDMSRRALELFSKEESFLLVIESGQIDWASHANDAGWLLHEMLRFENVLNYLLDFILNNPDHTLVVLSDHVTGGFGFSYRTKETGFFDKISSKIFNYNPGYDFIHESILKTLFKQNISIKQLSHKLEECNGKKSQIRELIYKYLSDYPSSLRDNIIEFCLKNKDEKEKIVNSIFGASRKNYPYYNSANNLYISHLLSSYQGVVWNTGTHTSSLIPFALIGKMEKTDYERPLTLYDVGNLLRKFYTGNAD